MKIGKVLLLVWLVLMLAACTGKTVRAVGPPLAESTEGTTEMSLTATAEPSSESLLSDVQSTEALPLEAENSEATSESTESAATDATTVLAVDAPDSADGDAVLVIESENAYTDAEKAKLLKEIDLLLDETLKDLNSGEVLNEWDDTTGGGQ